MQRETCRAEDCKVGLEALLKGEQSHHEIKLTLKVVRFSTVNLIAANHMFWTVVLVGILVCLFLFVWGVIFSNKYQTISPAIFPLLGENGLLLNCPGSSSLILKSATNKKASATAAWRNPFKVEEAEKWNKEETPLWIFSSVGFLGYISSGFSKSSVTNNFSFKKN